MARLEEIKKTIISENDVFLGWSDDLTMFEETYLYARELAEQMLGKGGCEGFQDFSNGIFSRDDLPRTVNTYPFGEKTDIIYPEYIGVCAGDNKLIDLFKNVNKQLKHYMVDSYEGRDRKSITVFTDKWDPKYLKKNEAIFLKAILLNNVFFNFYLVTDYGITRIPFMSTKQIEHFKREYSNERIEEAIPLSEYMQELGLYNMEYEIDQYDSWIPVQAQIRCRYEFDFRTLQYTYEDEQGDFGKGKINKAYALKFLRAAIALNESGGIGRDCGRPTNYVKRTVNLYKFAFEWYDNTGVENSPEVANMVEALMDMIFTLK